LGTNGIISGKRGFVISVSFGRLFKSSGDPALNQRKAFFPRDHRIGNDRRYDATAGAQLIINLFTEGFRTMKTLAPSRRFTLAAALTAMLTLAAFTGTANAQKIAAVDIKAVLTAMPEAQAADARIQATSKMWQDSLQTMRTQYQAKQDTYAKLGETASADYKKKEADDLQSLADQFTKFQEAKFGKEGELAQMQTQLLQPIYDKLRNALQAYAKKEKIAIIVDKSAAVYTDESADLTAKFQEYLKSQATNSK
jgi:outer membrane protein